MAESKIPNVVDTLPEILARDDVTLVAGTDKTALNRITYQLLTRYSDVADGAVLVTTNQDASTTIDEYTSIEDSEKPDIAVIDTTSTEQNVPTTYSEIPTVFTPAPGDLERTGMALADLPSKLGGEQRPIHLLVHSLSDIIHEMGIEKALKLFHQAASSEGSISGRTLLSVEYTTHDREALDALDSFADGVVWVERNGAELELTYDHNDRNSRFY